MTSVPPRAGTRAVTTPADAIDRALAVLRGDLLGEVPAADPGGRDPAHSPARVNLDGSESSEDAGDASSSSTSGAHVASDPFDPPITPGAGVWAGEELQHGGLAIEVFRLLDQDTGEVAEHVAYLSWERGVDGRHRYVRRTLPLAELVEVNLANPSDMRAAARKIHEQLGARRGPMSAEERWLAHAALVLEAES